jgi:hypothetical protein
MIWLDIYSKLLLGVLAPVILGLLLHRFWGICKITVITLLCLTSPLFY